jgi:DNA invertase Pin-like site-specific DNA recombinase
MACETYTNAVAYYRVSTQAQGQSGLGLDAQRASVERYAAQNCLAIVAEYTEIETGTAKRERPQIQRAIEAAKQNSAMLLIAKLDRLARNVAFISRLMDSGAKFTAVDMPQANELTIHIMAAMAQHEAKMISDRTRAALEAKRRRDGEWRQSQLDDDARQRGAETMRQRAIEAQRGATLTARLLRESGESLRAIARRLNGNGQRTRQGKLYTAATVKRMLDRV